MSNDKKTKNKSKKSDVHLNAPKEIMHIKNKDKQNHESWTPSRSRDIANFPSPTRIMLVGGVGTGKSNLIKNLIIHQSPMFDEVYLIHPDCELSKEYDDLEVTAKLDDIPSVDFFQFEDGNDKIKRCVIIDDLEYTAASKQRLKNLALLFRYVSSHKNLTVYLSHQSFFDIPGIAKKMSNIFIIWKPRRSQEKTLIEDRIGLKKGSLSHLFSTVATGMRDSICIDYSENSPAVLRKNIWTVLDPEEYI